MPPANVGAALGALRLLFKEPERVHRLAENSANCFLRLAKEEGLDTGMSHGSPIIPIITRSSIKALELAETVTVRKWHQRSTDSSPCGSRRRNTEFEYFMTSLHNDEQIRTSVQTIAEHWRVINGDPDGAKQVQPVA